MEIHTNTPQDPDKEYKLDKGSARPWVNLVLVFIIIVVMKGLLITSVHFLLSVNVGLNDRGADGEKLQLHAEIQRLTALLHNITSGLEEDRKWTESVKYCAKHNASLAIIQYEAEMEFIVGQMSRFSETPFLWIGLSDAEAEGVWAWLDGTLLQDHRFINVQWDAEHRDCADLRGDGSVFASDCESYGPWLCEKPMDIMPEIINHLQNYWHPSSGDK
ncbi:CD209 antigen-like protein C isoform X3 [Tachysurus fulvidraco]|uniref:CD209 antigen-like protein C isoform X3 n=1 Tax=Tachysurus fulvidraco TaxID=1234273 RepID=UPI001FEFECFF|nr:CD209 antigen-like protein C isoform X3 [Tachysurus fulvidraco]